MIDVNRIGILVFDDVEELDFVGPLEVFGMAARLRKKGDVSIVGHDAKMVRCRHGLQVIVHEQLSECADFDLFIVPGGLGARTYAVQSKPILDFIRRQPGIVASVCTGALVLAAAGLLEDKEATTHHTAFDMLRAYQRVVVREGKRLTKHARVWTSGGISAGIDMSLALVAHLWGQALADEISTAMEWRGTP